MANRYPRKKPSFEPIPGTEVSDDDRARWRAAWGLPVGTIYLGAMDSRPMPPGKPCHACQGERWWIEAQEPHFRWRCCNCLPAPDHLRIKHWIIDDPAGAAELDAIADEAPERHTHSADAAMAHSVGDTVTTPKEDDWI